MFTNADAVKLAAFFEPILQFDPLERFFPVAPEEMINHRATEDWHSASTHERGSAVLVADRSATSFGDADVRAGSHDPAGGNLQLDASAPSGIGQNFATSPAEDVFLDIAGWDDAASAAPPASGFSEGSIEYLDLLFRALGHAMNPSLALEQPDRTPQFTVPRVTQPTVVAEVEWAGRYPRLDAARVASHGGSRDFPPAISTDPPPPDDVMRELDSYVAINYYLLYPALEPAPGVRNDGVLRREGQWEAISVYLKGKPSDARDHDGRPDFEFTFEPPHPHGGGGLRGLTPRFLSYSQGYMTGDDTDSPLAGDVRVFNSQARVGSHPLAWVTAGTHKNLFEVDAVVTTGDSPPDPTLNPLGGAIMGAAGTLAGVCLGLSPPPLTPACIVCLIIAGVIFLIGLILFILSFFLKSDPPKTEAPDPASTDVARDGGPAGAVSGGTGPPSTPGLQPSGNVVQTILRAVNRFRFDPTPPATTYPPPSPPIAEQPSWWDYIGRWGVRVVNRPSNEWDNGTRRTDTFERTRGYWNTYRLVQFLNDPARASDGIGP